MWRRAALVRGTYLLVTANPALSLLILSTLMMEAIRFIETSLRKIPTRRHIEEDGFLGHIS
jgi:hypothetical protein